MVGGANPTKIQGSWTMTFGNRMSLLTPNVVESPTYRPAPIPKLDVPEAMELLSGMKRQKGQRTRPGQGFP